MSVIPQQTNTIGKWKIICDASQAPEIFNKLRLINLDAPQLFTKPPILVHNVYLPSAASIFCFTSADINDNRKIRKSAEFIRERIHYPFTMVCFDFDMTNLKRYSRLSYMHTPDGEFYKDNGEGLELVPLYTSLKVPTDERLLKYSKAEHWCGRLPSEVMDEEYIFVPSTEEGKRKMADEKGGKWMIFTSRNDITRHDNFFLAMVFLYRKGTFVGLKVATATNNEGGELQKLVDPMMRREGLMIFCYTDDSEDRRKVYKAARAIRKVIDYKCIIYYKTNADSIKGKYKHEGNWYMTKYMHTVGGGFYERDDLERFKLVKPSKNRFLI